MKEKAFENQIKRYIESLGGWWVKFHGNMYTRDGVPDLLCCIRGKFIAIEVKGSKGQPSKLQLYEIEKIKKAGGFAGVYYPEDFEKLKKDLKEVLSGGVE